mgnify:FL=1
MALEPLDNSLDETQEVNTGLDFSGIDDPMDPLSGVNLEQLEQQDPTPKPKPATKADLTANYNKQMKALKQFGSEGILRAQEGSRDPIQRARVVEFDANKSNIDRYLGYGKSTFNRVGFVPFTDNEKIFNEKTTIWNDLGRMSGVFGSLAYEGAMGGYRSMGSILSGEDFFSPDDKTAEGFDKANSIGMSSRGGFGGFANNFVLNSAYTVGIGVSILAEEMAMAGLEALTVGGATPLVAARTAMNMERLSKAFKLNAVGNIFKGSVQLAKSLGKVGDAKDFYTAVKAGSGTLGKGLFNFVNPASRTTQDLMDIAKGSASVRNLSNFAKMKQTFGSFYRDMRDANLALSESKLEGGSAKREEAERLLSLYEQENGKPAEGADLEKIYKQAEDVGYGVTAINFPIIYATNRVTFDGLFKFRGFRSLDNLSKEATLLEKGIGFKKGVGFTDEAALGFMEGAKKNLTSARYYGAQFGRFLNYSKRNLAEGFQENAQNIVSESVKNYYDGIYKDGTVGSLEYGSGLAWNAIKKEATTAQGAETFASGFLMGGFIGVSQNAFLNKAPNIYYQLSDPTKYAEYKEAKAKSKADAIAGLNEMYSNPLKYFSSKNESAVIQKKSADAMNTAEENGDAKTFQDAKDIRTFDHVFQALDNGTFDNLLSSYAELKKLDNDELADFLGIAKTEKASEKLDEIVSRAKEIKNRYEVVNTQFANPFNPRAYKAKTPEFEGEAIAYKAFEQAKRVAVASQHSFDRSLERMTKVYSDLVADKPVAKASNSDLSVLFDINDINNEIDILKKEITGYVEPTAEQKKLIKQKTAKLESLQDYKDKLNSHLESLSANEVEENGQFKIQFSEDTTNALRKSYEKYLKQLASVNNDYVFNEKIDDSFAKVLDYYSLNQDSKDHNNAVNTLLDPTNLYKLAESISEYYTKLWGSKDENVAERIDKAQRMMEFNNLLKTLAAQGIMITPEQLEDFVENDVRPTTFLDAATGQPLDPTSEKAILANDIMKIDDEIKDQPEPAPVEEAPAPVVETPVQEAKPTEELPADLEALLRAAHDNYVISNDSDITFENYIATSTTASRIKDTYYKNAQVPTTESAPTEPTPSVDSVEISSNSKGLAAALTNPTELAKKKGNLTESYPVTVRGKEYPDAEAAYQALKGTATKDDGPNSTYNLMVEILKAKLEQYPRLVSEIDKAGGKSWLSKATHQPTSRNTVWETGGKNWFIKALTDAYLSVKGPESVVTEENIEPTKESGLKKAQDILNSVSSIKDLPNLNAVNGNPFTFKLLDLISSGEVTSKEIIDMVEKRRQELSENLSLNDIKTGDIVIFTDGRKGIVKSMTKDAIKVKLFNSKSKGLEVVPAAEISKKIKMVENGKIAAVEETVQVEVAPENKPEVEASKDTVDSFTSDAARVKNAINDVMANTGKDNSNNIQNIIDNLGCKTKGA